MTDEEIAEARRLLDASTADIPGDETDKHIELRLHERTVAERTFMARMAPALLADVERLTGELAEAETELDGYDKSLKTSYERLAADGVSLKELAGDRDRARDAAVALKQENARLSQRIAEAVKDARERDERLLAQRDRTASHDKALGIERGAHDVRAIADFLEGREG